MSELGTLLADTVTRLFNDLVTKDLIESAEKGVWPDKLWRALEEGGLTLPLVDEARGGAGGTWADAHTVVRAAGTHAAPVPLAETIVAGWVVGPGGTRWYSTARWWWRQRRPLSPPTPRRSTAPWCAPPRWPARSSRCWSSPCATPPSASSSGGPSATSRRS